MLIAPLIMNFQEGIFQYMVKTEILFGSPILLILLAGYFFRQISAKAANITLVSYLVALSLFQYVIKVDLHFLHVLALLFALHAGLILALARVFPNRRESTPPDEPTDIDLRPWKHFRLVSGIALSAMVLIYVVFSPWGVVTAVREKAIDHGFIAAGLVLGGIIFVLPLRHHFRRRRE
jgi:SSS family solute:Na+ symporter